MKLCLKCEEAKVPRGIKFCLKCAKEINDIHENPMIHMRSLRALTEGQRDRTMETYGFLSIMHPKMSHRAKMKLIK